MIIMEYCGGASCPIWGSAFRAAGKVANGKLELSIKEFADMLPSAVKAIQANGKRSFGRGTVVGDKTLVDAIVPCANSWAESTATGESFKTAFEKVQRRLLKEPILQRKSLLEWAALVRLVKGAWVILMLVPML